MSLIQRYADWLVDKSYELQGHDYFLVSVPFLTRCRESLDLCVKEFNDGHYVTDYGETLREVEELYGWDLYADPSCLDRINVILKFHGLMPVSSSCREVYSGKMPGDFAASFHAVLCAMIEINELLRGCTLLEEKPR